MAELLQAVSCLSMAGTYAGRGWHVLPVWWPQGAGCGCGADSCDKPGKHPIGRLVPHGLKDGTVDPHTLVMWWRSYPRANMGIVTGAASGIIVLDIDPRHGGDESLRDLEAAHGPMPTTAIVLTGGGGTHYYLRHPGRSVRCRTGIAPGIDLKADGGYVVAPPSLHASGGQYLWEAGLGL